ncbi:MAG: thiamine phosphate synthase [Burkholderiales bacterium]
MKIRIEGLYVVTPEQAGVDWLIRSVDAALRGGARIVQFRDKSGDAIRRRVQAGELAALCRRAGACFIVNDDVELAREVNADGVHLGEHDVGIATARERLGREKLIGASCYNRADLAYRAVHAGADYLAFGSFFASLTKPDAVRADVRLLALGAAGIGIPIVAIGGISTDNAAELIAAGADAVAVSGALFGVVDIERVARDFSRLFENSPEHSRKHHAQEPDII